MVGFVPRDFMELNDNHPISYAEMLRYGILRDIPKSFIGCATNCVRDALAPVRRSVPWRLDEMYTEYAGFTFYKAVERGYLEFECTEDWDYQETRELILAEAALFMAGDMNTTPREVLAYFEADEFPPGVYFANEREKMFTILPYTSLYRVLNRMGETEEIPDNDES